MLFIGIKMIHIAPVRVEDFIETPYCEINSTRIGRRADTMVSSRSK